jgi:hypothetical protein
MICSFSVLTSTAVISLVQRQTATKLLEEVACLSLCARPPVNKMLIMAYNAWRA